jgi:hypothetical protein
MNSIKERTGKTSGLEKKETRLSMQKIYCKSEE